MCHFGGKRSLKAHSLPRARVVKFESVRVEALTRNEFCMFLCRAAFVAAVNAVAKHGMPDARHMNAYLMRSSGFELALDQRNTVESLLDRPMSNRFARAAVADYCHTFAVNGMATDGSIDRARILAR